MLADVADFSLSMLSFPVPSKSAGKKTSSTSSKFATDSAEQLLDQAVLVPKGSLYASSHSTGRCK